MDLKSVSKPVGAQFESAAAQTPSKVLPGHAGTAPVEESRAARLLVSGKSDTPIKPAGTGATLESVIAADDRTRILETEMSPWRMICALRIKSSVGEFVGTGWFVSPRTILTAGHCVHDSQQMNGWADSIEISPGRDHEELPFGTVTSANLSTLSIWVEERDPDFDIGCIQLDQAVGEQTGWFSVAALPAEKLESHQVNISGYPADRGRGEQQWFHANRVLSVSARRVFYDIDTFGGQSGSPVWIHEQVDSPPVAVGIHAYGIGGTPSTMGITANSAPRILPETFDIIQQWIDENAVS